MFINIDNIIFIILALFFVSIWSYIVGRNDKLEKIVKKSNKGELAKIGNKLYRLKETEVLDIPKYDWIRIKDIRYFIVKLSRLKKLMKKENLNALSELLYNGRPIRVNSYIYHVTRWYASSKEMLIEAKEESAILEGDYKEE